ncbi:MAG: exodeoxyribonuclease III, partial [Thermodesulfobacteriota bacterium]|nr:exodeoxyribonuclease III [Thermodesulfobacteriota bacterium]
MKIYSWNVNGFRAVIQKGFWDWLGACGGDVVCLQETKVHPDQLSEEDKLEGYEAVWNPCKVKKGYSGVAAFYRLAPQSFSFGLPDEKYQGEGRLILMDYGTFYLLNVYFPNGQMSDERLKFKMGYYDAFLSYAELLRKTKPVVVCGDFNTAHKEIDLKNPKANEKTSGFLLVERAWLDKFIEHGYVDTFRMFESQGGNYSWWSYRFGARSRNAGWRIDYFFVSKELEGAVKAAWIENKVMGSDHCPVGLELDVR